MAVYIPKPLQYLTYDPSQEVQDLSSGAMKLSRGVILASRGIGAARGKFTHVNEPNRSLSDRLNVFEDREFPQQSEGLITIKESRKEGQTIPEFADLLVPNDAYTPTEINYGKRNTYKPTDIIIINLDAGEEPGDSGYEELVLHAVPRELKVDPSSNFVGLASIGRNNPHYQYSGSEDTLEFSIDWYCKNLDRAEVIRNCRWVEALTKSNGYKKRPPVVKIKWGEEDILFSNDLWIVVSAPYQLSNFQTARASADPKTFRPDGKIIKLGSLPQQAYQNVKLKRITHNNRKWQEIKDIPKLRNNKLLDESLPNNLIIGNPNFNIS